MSAADLNKSKKTVSVVAKIEYTIINSNRMQEIMAGQKKKLKNYVISQILHWLDRNRQL